MNAQELSVSYVGPFLFANGRNRAIIRGLREHGVNVVLVNSDSEFRAIRFLQCGLGALRNNGRTVIMGARGDFFGQPLMVLKKMMGGRSVVFDGVLSLYETMVVDRKYYDEDSVTARALFLLDRLAFGSCDMLLSDSETHARYYSSLFGIPISKIKTLYIGTDDSVFYPRRRTQTSGFFEIGFWGGFIPLQGVDTIVEAAHILSKEHDIRFTLLGSGQTLESAKCQCMKLNVTNVQFAEGWLPYESLPEFINRFDITLGIFSKGIKAQNVIPNKVYESLAMSMPIITADTPAAREILRDNENCFMTLPGDAVSLSDRILEAKSNPRLCERVAHKGYELFKSQLTPEAVGEKLLSILSETRDRNECEHL